MFGGNVNVWAVLVASVISMALGMTWYSPKVFGKKWMKLTNVKPKKEGKGKSAFLGFVTTLITIYVMAGIFSAVGVMSAIAGLVGGLTLWLGFVATITLGSVLWEQKPVELWILNASYWLVNFLIVGLILGIWL